MTDELAISQIDDLSADDYKTAFTALREQMSESELLMLKAHYQSPAYDTTATQLANLVGSQRFLTANRLYGHLAGKLLRFFQIKLERYVKINVLVFFNTFANYGIAEG